MRLEGNTVLLEEDSDKIITIGEVVKGEKMKLPAPERE